MSEQLMTPAEIERATVERCASLADSLYAEAREDEITQAIRALPPMFGDVPAVVPTREEIARLAQAAGFPPHIVNAGVDREFMRFAELLLAAAPTAGQAAAKDAAVPSGRHDLERVLHEWNEATGALPRDSGWLYEVRVMMQDAAIDAAMPAAPEVK